MADQDGGEKDPDVRSAHGDQDSDSPLQTWERVAFGALGLAVGGGGAVASFIDGTNPGGVPVVGVGGVFGYLAISGQRLQSLKVGGTEARLTNKLLRSPNLSDEAKREVAEELEVSELPLPPRTRDAVKRVLSASETAQEYDHRVRDAIERLHPEALSGWIWVEEASVDGLLQSPSGASVAIIIKYTHRLLSDGDVLRHIRAVPPALVRDLLVVVSTPFATDRYRLDADNVEAGVVTWRDPSDDEALDAAITAALVHADRRWPTRPKDGRTPDTPGTPG